MIFKDKDISITKCKMFCGISEKSLRETFKQIHYQVRKFEKGQYIIIRNTPCKELQILISGSVKAEIKNFSDTTVKIADIHAPDSLASAFLFGENNKYPVDVLAETEVNILWIPKQEVIKMFHINPDFLKNYLDRISTRAQFLTDKLKFLSFQTIKGKLAFFILKTSNEQSKDEFIIEKTQQELSEMFGVTRPSLARALKQLDIEGLIKIKQKHMKILNKVELAKYLKYEDKLHN